MTPEENTILNSKEIRDGFAVLESKPIQINIDLTGRCNIHPPCVFCDGRAEGYGYPPLDSHSFKLQMPFITQCTRITDCSYGEPLSHPEFIKIVREALSRDQGFTFSTNGLLLKPSVSDALIEAGYNLGCSVSVNASSPETYFKLTGKNLSVVMDNVLYFSNKYSDKYGHIPPLALSFIVMHVNQSEVSDFIYLAHNMKIPTINFRHLFADPEAKPRDDFGYNFDYNTEMLTQKEYAEVEQKAKTVGGELGLNLVFHWIPDESAIEQLAEPGVSIPCLFPWKFLFYQNHTGNIYPCCYSDSAIGHLEDGDTLESVWNGNAFKDLREDLANEKLPEYCKNHGKYCPLVLSKLKCGGMDL